MESCIQTNHDLIKVIEDEMQWMGDHIFGYQYNLKNNVSSLHDFNFVKKRIAYRERKLYFLIYYHIKSK